MYKLLIVSTFLLFAFGQTVLGCSLLLKPLAKYDPNEYLFTGKVVGYTEPRIMPESGHWGTDSKYQRVTYGLIVELKEEIHLPKKPGSYFEIFEFGIGGLCELRPVKLEYLEKNFPITTEVRVNAKTTDYFKDEIPSGIVRLSTVSTHSLLIGNVDSKGNPLTTAESVYKYESFKSTNGFSEDPYLPMFELKKDLLRLNQSKTQKDKDEILERIVYFPPKYIWMVDIEEIIRNHSKAPNKFIDKFEKHLKTFMNDKELKNFKEWIERGRKL